MLFSPWPPHGRVSGCKGYDLLVHKVAILWGMGHEAVVWWALRSHLPRSPFSTRWWWRSHLGCSSTPCTPLLQILSACCAQMTPEIPSLLEAEWSLLCCSGRFRHWWTWLCSGNTLGFGMNKQNNSLGVVWYRAREICSKNPREVKSSLRI